MSEKLAEVYEKYHIEIVSSRRGRGATIVTTKNGLYILEPFRGSVIRLEQEKLLKDLLEQQGFHDLDCMIPNQDGELLTYDRYRQPFVLKRHFEGEECDMHNLTEVIRAVEKLAQFHLCGKMVAKEFPSAWQKVKQQKERIQVEEIRQALAEGEEPEQVAKLYGMTPAGLTEFLRETEEKVTAQSNKQTKHLERTDKKGAEESVLDLIGRRNRELRKIHKFVGGVKRKNDFENLFLQVYPEYYKKGLQCEALHEKIMQDGESISHNHYGVCHGNFNQHNVIMGEDYEAIVHFERFSVGNQLEDLYQFSRKVMEKNHFDYEMLEWILQTYGKNILLSQQDYRYLYILFSYPEKFWKIANGYYNSSKAFLSPKYVEKLNTLIDQEKEKREMLAQYYAFHLAENSI